MEGKKATMQNAFGFVKSFVSPEEESIDVMTSKGFVQDLISRLKRVEISALAAQLAYFFLLSFFPLLIFLVTLLPYLNLETTQVYSFLVNILPDEVYKLIENTLNEILTNRNSSLLSIGVLGTIWSASKGINALIRALNKAYDTEGRAGILDRGLSLVFTIALVIVMAVALLLPVFGQQIGHFLFSIVGIEEQFESIWHKLRWSIPPLLIFIVLMGIYWVVPNTSPRLKIMGVWPGAMFATLAWLAVTYGFSFYINNFANYSATYGSIGGVIILMLWLYFTGIIIIFGGVLNATMQKRALQKELHE
ncbi:MAG TPA: YihY/virulence factor BrkB family protein [Lysinibacillus sp.]|jgi:membrane protein|uniref:YihY/virulence factor BrkB family protein n=1 Tax=Lysinibacillus fusiformis TaxID=28031 RepID=A0A2I0UWH8_9BACI|nr:MULTISPECIES: YihY/virulence factor BrkB family protein [Lysinibacillus]HBT71897.1 YihY/virulence factor BrkB family protein [Lysinibacillus sp.]KUF35709.1 ribonuclease [Lysinibacillus sp. F5]MEE3809267.1 YihY/virulence factor BrkB family protein [Lysinibacillus fusiformis]PKU50397.1 YihY/virulence factor BrkB family protein [Lysinibacillus fusiformis]WCH47227.1 YihY/virulence factor BrkB family protein [Lysinibacillus sp. OF-1]